MIAYHDARIAAGASATAAAADDGDAWLCDRGEPSLQPLLWDEEDQARRTDVADAAIAANKRAIDATTSSATMPSRRSTRRCSARIGVSPASDAWHNSETAGSMIDRLSILALKIFHMRSQTRRTDATAEHVGRAAEARPPRAQRDDLARCHDTLLARAAEGRAFWRIYRQFKMYNDPDAQPVSVWRRQSLTQQRIERDEHVVIRKSAVRSPLAWRAGGACGPTATQARIQRIGEEAELATRSSRRRSHEARIGNDARPRVEYETERRFDRSAKRVQVRYPWSSSAACAIAIVARSPDCSSRA